MGTRGGFGMILHAKDREFFMSESFDGMVVEIDMREFKFRREGAYIDSEAMVL